MTAFRPRSTAHTESEERDAYAAPVQDPFWMLGRQLQTEEWRASTGGSQVAVEVSYTVAPLIYEGAELTGPLEPQVEAEPAPAPDLIGGRTRARWGTELVRLLRHAQSPEAAHALTFTLPYLPPEPAAASARFAHRIPDPVAVHQLLATSMGPDRSGPLPDVAGLPHTEAVRGACRTWMQRMDLRLGISGPAAKDTWLPQRLEHQFVLTTATAGAAITLTAPDYDGGGADWHTFDRNPTHESFQAPTVHIQRARSAPIDYRGMPLRSYWRFERGDVDLDLLDYQDQDEDQDQDQAAIARSVLRAFALQFNADWHIVPLPVPAGAVQVVTLQVTDTFGETINVADVAEIDAGGPWQFLDTHYTGEEADSAARAGGGLRVLLPPSPTPLEGPVLEDVLFARDEVANLGWVIERQTLDADGVPVDRLRRHLERRTASDPAFTPGRRPGSATYRLSTAVPEHWYPLLPSRSDDGRATLVFAEVPAEARPTSDADVHGTLVPHQSGTLIFDEEVPGDGALITRRDRLLLHPTGAIVWRARTKRPGSGGASSGLQFDALR